MSKCGCKSTPCGCKANATAVAVRSTCGCGGGGCRSCEPRSFVRPRFFAGQLLTEDDLDLLGEYVVGKNRLHNRALWGPGVVCGLDVHCDPCGGASVVVSPGYALNCCGDDVVVPCAETVDIVGLIKQLNLGSLGGTCADPCDDRPSTSGKGAAPDPKAPIRRYFLYIRYVEDATDPVSPYATDEPCAQVCEPTRIREGHRFELRCTDDNPQFMGLGDRVVACIGDVRQATSAAADATVMNRDALRLASAQQALLQTPAPIFAPADVAALRTATADLRGALALLPPTTKLATNATASTPPLAPAPVRAAVEALRVAGSLFGRLVITPLKQRPQIDSATTSDAQAQLAAALESVPAALGVASLSPLETAEAQATLGFVGQLATLEAPPVTITYGQQLWALGAPLDDALYGQLATAQARVASYAAPILRGSARLNDCQLLAQLEGIRPVAAGPITAGSVTGLAQSATLTSQVLGRLLLECICDAFNPPCQSCDDPAVLLAEICVQDCTVVGICELVRRFVITWPSVRYWTDIPNFAYNIDHLGKVFETLCCELRGQLGGGCPPSATTKQLISSIATTTLGGPAIALAAPTSPTAAQPFAQLGELLPLIQPLATATAVVPGGIAPMVDSTTAQAIQSRVNDAVTAAMASTQSELAALRAQVAKLATRGG